MNSTMDAGVGGGGAAAEFLQIRLNHRHDPKENQCSSVLVKHIQAPVHLVWSLVRRFDQPQKYKPFVSRCVMKGDIGIGSVREVDVKSGLPATTSTERLELLDDNEHILGIRIVGGDHRLKNYSSVVTVHPEIIDGRAGTMVWMHHKGTPETRLVTLWKLLYGAISNLCPMCAREWLLRTGYKL